MRGACAQQSSARPLRGAPPAPPPHGAHLPVVPRQPWLDVLPVLAVPDARAADERGLREGGAARSKGAISRAKTQVRPSAWAWQQRATAAAGPMPAAGAHRDGLVGRVVEGVLHLQRGSAGRVRGGRRAAVSRRTRAGSAWRRMAARMAGHGPPGPVRRAAHHVGVVQHLADAAQPRAGVGLAAVGHLHKLADLRGARRRAGAACSGGGARMGAARAARGGGRGGAAAPGLPRTARPHK
jgi:hypothetical protein